ncbi:YibE/F family protein [Petroclostridium sp. X23]|uniref:YibE/F family protein n=1 Tax=Petroclostridium sp. X23 TaxID=3045146 RepID=UPI0024ACDF5A|nr:YibE/F family protein [Petroclostridium sp. X23]WHH60279.1 YibE/F family protein [Petroclostridium sp. X23]
MKNAIPILTIIILIAVTLGLFIYDDTKVSEKIEDVVETQAIVIEVDNSNVIQSNVSSIGYQLLTVKVLQGKYKDRETEATNNMLGNLEMDNFYKPGDKIIVALLEKNDQIWDAKALDMDRQQWELILFGAFVLCLVLYARITGLKALFSFIASLYVIWKLFIPGLLKGENPLILGTMVLTLLTALIIFSIAGFTRKGLAAFLGTMSGMIATIGLTILFGMKLRLDGLTEPYAATLLISGHLDLNMRHIFYTAIIIGASGAAMDIAMDVAASMEEVMLKKPDIGVKELIQSGFNVGRAVIGTMTTTLLLAYSGGYLTLLMLFMTKNSSFIRIMNLKIVSAEIMRTVVGSIGLVLVAPITAILAGWIYTMNVSFLHKKAVAQELKEE